MTEAQYQRQIRDLESQNRQLEADLRKANQTIETLREVPGAAGTPAKIKAVGIVEAAQPNTPAKKPAPSVSLREVDMLTIAQVLNIDPSAAVREGESPEEWARRTGRA